MTLPERNTYLKDTIEILKLLWPKNRAINIVCHGHSVPAGYYATPFVDTFNSYPHMLHKELKAQFPFAVINVIVAAIGGETSETGSERFVKTVLCHHPDVITIDYGLNDRRIGLDKSEKNLRYMIEQAIEKRIKVILLTPSMDTTCNCITQELKTTELYKQALLIRKLAEEYIVALADTFAAFENYISFDKRNSLYELLSAQNHPSRKGHKLIVKELMKWFPV